MAQLILVFTTKALPSQRHSTCNNERNGDFWIYQYLRSMRRSNSSGSLGLSFLCLAGMLMFMGRSGAQVFFEKTYGTPESEYANDAVQAPDGGIVVTGNILDTGQLSKIFIMKTDSAGVLQWVKTISTPWSAKATRIRLTQGGYLIAGYTLYTFALNWTFTLIKVDYSGNLLWLRRVGGAGVTDFDITSDYGTIIAGQILSFVFPSGHSTICLVRTDSLGNHIWGKSYDFDEPQLPFCVKETPEKGFIVTGYTNSFGNASASAMFLMKTDSVGSQLWMKMYKHTSLPSGTSGAYLVIMPDSGYLVAGSMPFNSLVRTDKMGNVRWLKFMPSGTPQRLIQTPDGGALGIYRTNQYKMGAYKVDTAGNVLWNKVFRDLPFEFGLTCFSGWQADSVSYILVSSDSINSNDVYITRTSASPFSCGIAGPSWPAWPDSCIVSSNGFNEETVLNNIDSMPVMGTASFWTAGYCYGFNGMEEKRGNCEIRLVHDPLYKSLVLCGNDVPRGEAECSIFNLNGMAIKRFNWMIDGETADVSSLSPGMYLITLHADDCYYSGKFVVKD